MNTLTQKRLKELLEYNPDTGIFTNREYRGGIAKKDAISGSLNDGGYWKIVIDRKNYLAHRLAWLYMNGSFPKDQIDHINHIGTDNRIVNLREVTNLENHKNQSIPSNNTSGVIGICWNKQRKKWCPSIRVNGKLIFLGRFTKKEDAIIARKKAEKLYGFHKNHGAAIML